MKYRPYLPIMDYRNPEIKGITKGHCCVFPKLNGVFGSMWLNEGVLQVADKNGQIHMDGNENVRNSLFVVALNAVRIFQFLQKNPSFRLYFVWLRPDVIFTYKKEAVGRIYIVDVVNTEHYGDITLSRYMNYFEYFEYLKKNELEEICVPLIQEGKNISIRDLEATANKNQYLVEKGIGAGIIVKNYHYCNSDGHQAWMKIDSDNYNYRKNNVKTK